MATNDRIEISLNSRELAEQVVRVAREAAEEIVAARFDDFLRDEVDAAMSARVLAIADERLRAEIDKILADGWQKTNSYGEPSGQRTTLSGILRDYFTDRDSFRNPVDRIFKEKIDEALRGELKPLLAEAKARLQALLDKTIADKLRAAVSEALK